MPEVSRSLRVVLFSGGRGTGSIADALLRHPQIRLTLLVNAYDDGLSTGRIRAFVPGMLGPSDIRKCCARLMPDDTRASRELRALVEHRFPAGTTRDDGLAVLDAIARLELDRLPPILAGCIGEIGLLTVREIALFARVFHEYAASRSNAFDYEDCSLGNLLFAGAYLSRNRDFNAAVRAFVALTDARGDVIHVTDGENLVLVGLKEDGTILASEAELVGPQSRVPLRDIYLLRDYLDPATLEALCGLAPDEIHAFLEARSVYPRMNPDCAAAIESADIVIYGPGTQHSSLYPSYLTQGLGEAVRSNRSAEKIFVANIRVDHEIQAETSASLVQKFTHYMRRKGRVRLAPEELAGSFFVHASAPDAGPRRSLLPSSTAAVPPGGNVVRVDWESNRGEHMGGRVVDEVVSLVNLRAQATLAGFHYMISIVVTCRDDAETVQRVLRELMLLDMSPLGLGKEVILVDGGSLDGSFELASQVRGVRCLRTRGASGRGDVLRAGLEAAAGDIVVFFPSDGEYRADDVLRVVSPIVDDQFKVVFGSRTVRVTDLSAHMRQIYPADRLAYFVGKWGGITLSIASLLVHNRSVSDPLTGLKAFDRRLLRALDLRSSGFEVEGEIIAKLAAANTLFLEVPIEFQSRRRAQGKKTSVFDGLRALRQIVRRPVPESETERTG
ncbi:MAG TPA: 2-phospho-L-lactate transferase CofD family protein [Polyangiaceae bacterium]|jgi:2-phospho-L-lactate transferase/gluconeogenesis factor (CofD/UPF0052 family)